jgi:hypothetical protein
MNQLIELITANGFNTWTDGDPEPSYSDRPLAMLRLDYTEQELRAPNHCEIGILCANNCVPNQGHECYVAMPAGALRTDEWLQRVCAKNAWMVLMWGEHGHRLPFCCVSCLIEFTTRRAHHD